MPVTDRFSCLPRGAVVTAAFLLALGACDVAPALAITPAAAAITPHTAMVGGAPIQPVNCVPGTAGCATGTAPAMPSQFQGVLGRFPAGWHGGPPDRCAPHVHRDGEPDCNAVATGAILQGVSTIMQMFQPAAPPPQPPQQAPH